MNRKLDPVQIRPPRVSASPARPPSTPAKTHHRRGEANPNPLPLLINHLDLYAIVRAPTFFISSFSPSRSPLPRAFRDAASYVRLLSLSVFTSPLDRQIRSGDRGEAQKSSGRLDSPSATDLY